ncbi:efflux RND transporter permease subunit [Xanthovirga aplysinae]|uniref:efflux RND transporter permease subunit n=1 Tax=Xanthovirga aplysinae TaxID=2529853 RepID=UPI0012BBBFCC|nr:efflux RND transporter permease subunit [Xanthovirga aplysinae]MTI33177.1 efflux RND transporter permease subunit [Xanthovirga aplysinae]
MNITRSAIEQNRITITILVLVFFTGIGTYRTMPRAEDPGFVVRVALVVTSFPGASPERVELLVTDKIEKVIQEIPELDYVNSISKTGLSVIMVHIKESHKVMRPIWDNLRRKVEKVQPDLPEGAIPVVNDEYGDVFGIIVALTGEGYSYAELKKIADRVKDEFKNVKDVAKVDLFGVQDERIFVEYENARLAELGLTSFNLRDQLEARNIIDPGGSIKIEEERLFLEPTGNFESVKDIKRTVIQLPQSGELVYLEDIAEVKRGYIEPVDSKFRVNGVPGIALAISMAEGGNLINLGQSIEEMIDELEENYPYGIDMEMVAYQHRIVNGIVNSFILNLLEAIAIVFAVMLLFLGFRTGMIIASLIPMAILSTLMIMGLLDIWLDQVSLAALIIALGMLVDNAIVMTESILVRVEKGKTIKEAAVASSKELIIPLLISSLTTCAAFLPIYLAKSAVGEFTAALFKVVSICLLSSWLLSLTMTPLFCVWYIKKTRIGKGEKIYRFQQIYKRFLLLNLERPYIFLMGILGMFLIALFIFGFVPRLFFPESSRNLVIADIEMPMGSDIDYTDEIIGKIETFIGENLQVDPTEKGEGVLNWGSWIGEMAPKYALSYNPEPGSPEIGYILLNTTSQKINASLMHPLDSFCQLYFPDLTARVKLLTAGPASKYPIEVRISGEDKDVLFEIVEKAKLQLASIKGTKNIGDDWGGRTKKLTVKVNQTKARLAGVTSQDIAVSLQTVLTGFETSKYREEDLLIPIVMRNVEADRQDLGKLENLNIYAQVSGEAVPLKQVADIVTEWEPSNIRRRNRLKTVTVYAYMEEGFTANEIILKMTPWLEEQKKDWRLGYKYEIGGENEKSDEANQSINDQLPVAGFVILMLLIWQFNSFRKTLIIILTIILGLIGVFWGLFLMDSYFGFMTFLGVVSLSGIVVNNAIVLIDTIQIELQTKEPQQAIISAALSRFRPIILTTLTTIMGLLPLWFGGAPMWKPMAIAIIFGLLFATILTLVFVPVVYSLLYKVSFKK